MLDKLMEELDKEVTQVYEEYLGLHNELNKHRGKEIGDTNLDEVNRLLKEIQECFAKIYPIFHWIAYRHQLAVNATREYGEFIDLLKKVGAREQEAN